MNKYELQLRTKKFHVDVIRLMAFYPKNVAGFETARQLIKSAGSVGANYRAACRAKSTADFIYKLDVILEEADESLYWLEVSKEADLIQSAQLDLLIREATEIVKIFNAADMTVKRNASQKSKNPPIPKSKNQK